MNQCKYGKIKVDHSWMLTVNGEPIAKFARESDVDAIINIEAQLSKKTDAANQASEFISCIPLHSENTHVQHYVDMAKAWLKL